MQNVFLIMGHGQRKLKNSDLEDWSNSCGVRQKDQDTLFKFHFMSFHCYDYKGPARVPVFTN